MRLAARFGAHLTQRIGLRLAAALGDRFGEVGEQDCEPEPDHDLEFEQQVAAPVMTSRIRMTVVEERDDLQ